MSDIITGTPAGLTYEHALVQEAWLAAWIITSAALALIIGWIGLSLIDLLLALAPAAMGLWILPQTAGWSRQWLRLFATTVAQQAVQLIAFALGIGFLAELAEIGPFEPARDLVWKLLMAVGFVYLATRVPSMLGNSGPFDPWLRTLYFAASLPMNVARSAASLSGFSGAGTGGLAAAVGHASGATASKSGQSMAELSSPPSRTDLRTLPSKSTSALSERPIGPSSGIGIV